nr:MAG TPA: Head Tail Connector Protein [Caudoviricetes sp.]
MGIYADYNFYAREYLQGKNPTPTIGAGFDYYARGASRIIDLYTFGRLEGVEDIPKDVKFCCCELAELICENEAQSKDTGNKTSERIGSYSVGFSSKADREESFKSKQYDIVIKWLGNTGLCYRGL